jgi:hypothetical protein
MPKAKFSEMNFFRSAEILVAIRSQCLDTGQRPAVGLNVISVNCFEEI